MAAMKPRTGDGPLEVTKEGRGIVMRVPLEGGGRLVVELNADEATRSATRSRTSSADRWPAHAPQLRPPARSRRPEFAAQSGAAGTRSAVARGRRGRPAGAPGATTTAPSSSVRVPADASASRSTSTSLGLLEVEPVRPGAPARCDVAVPVAARRRRPAPGPAGRRRRRQRRSDFRRAGAALARAATDRAERRHLARRRSRPTAALGPFVEGRVLGLLRASTGARRPPEQARWPASCWPAWPTRRHARRRARAAAIAVGGAGWRPRTLALTSRPT